MARRTPLYPVHLELGARMVEFAGWDMPVQYTGVLEEHSAVRQRAGIFDVSHMGEVAVRGREALALLQLLTCNDVARLAPGRIHYSALTTPAGTFVDDLLVYHLAPNDYLLVVNASNTEKDFAWIAERARAFDVTVDNESEGWAQIAVQGPASPAIVEALCGASLAQLRYYTFERRDVAGASSIVSRTGYTGEDGFEIYCPSEAAARIWRALAALGAAHGLAPAGLAARDTLRLEAKLALYGNDIDDTTTVLEADLGFIVKLDKGDFLGRDVLARQNKEGVSRKLVGFEMEGRPIARHGYGVFAGAQAAGAVTSGSLAPTLKKNIGLAYLPIGSCAPGSRLEVEIRGRREPARVVPTPFYKRPR